MEDLSDLEPGVDLPPRHLDVIGSFYPYPNETSFRLGDWYWNGGVQKSQQSFRDLLGIVGSPSFSSEDVRKRNWSQIDKTLHQQMYMCLIRLIAFFLVLLALP